MTVRLSDAGTILLIDDCPADDADHLLRLLVEEPEAAIDWSTCRSAHTAVIQVMLASGRKPTGKPGKNFLKTLIGPALGRARP